MNLKLAKSEAAKYSQEWGVALSVIKLKDGEFQYKRINEISSTEELVTTYQPDPNGPLKEIKPKQGFFSRIFNW